MTWLDLLLLAILLFFVLTGLIRGFIKELFGKVSVVGGIFFAIILTPFLEQKIILLGILWKNLQLYQNILQKKN